MTVGRTIQTHGPKPPAPPAPRPGEEAAAFLLFGLPMAAFCVFLLWHRAGELRAEERVVLQTPFEGFVFALTAVVTAWGLYSALVAADLENEATWRRLRRWRTLAMVVAVPIGTVGCEPLIAHSIKAQGYDACISPEIKDAYATGGARRTVPRVYARQASGGCQSAMP